MVLPWLSARQANRLTRGTGMHLAQRIMVNKDKYAYTIGCNPTERISAVKCHMHLILQRYPPTDPLPPSHMSPRSPLIALVNNKQKYNITADVPLQLLIGFPTCNQSCPALLHIFHHPLPLN